MIYFIGDYDREFKENIERIDIDTAISLIKGNKIIAEDIETTTLDFFKESPITLIQIGTKHDQFVFHKSSDLTKLKEIFEDRNIIKINANGIFERTMLRSLNIQLNSMFDLLLAFKVYRQGRDDRQVKTEYGSAYIYSLAGMYKELLDKDMSKEVRSSFESGRLTEEQILYAAKDVEIFDLFDKIVGMLIKKGMLNKDFEYGKAEDLLKKNKLSVTILEMLVLEFFADMKYNGINIDKKRWLKLAKINRERYLVLEKEMNEIVVNSIESYRGYKIEPFSNNRYTEYDIFGNEIKKEVKKKDSHRINWSSSLQVKPIFKERFGYIPKEKGKETLDIKILSRDKKISEDELGNRYIQYKKLMKLYTSYGEKYFKNIHPKTNRIHFDVNQVLTTGRVASRNPNLSQIPSTKEWRDCFTASEGYDIVGADYSAQESQVMADKAGDSIFIDFFKNGGGDSHSMIASIMFSSLYNIEMKVSKFAITFKNKKGESKEVEELANKLYPKANEKKWIGNDFIIEDKEKKSSNPLRTKGKTLNFLLSFGGSAYTLAKQTGMDEEEAEKLVNGFWKGFPELAEYFDKEKEFAIKNGYSLISKITGRKRFYPKWKEYRIVENIKQRAIREYEKKYGKITDFRSFFKRLNKDPEFSYKSRGAYKIKKDIEKESMNAGIQGFAADMTKLAAILLMERIEELGYSTIKDIKPINYIHDELLTEVLKELSKLGSKILSECMEKASELLCNHLVIPAEPYIAKEWQK